MIYFVLQCKGNVSRHEKRKSHNFATICQTIYALMRAHDSLGKHHVINLHSSHLLLILNSSITMEQFSDPLPPAPRESSSSFQHRLPKCHGENITSLHSSVHTFRRVVRSLGAPGSMQCDNRRPTWLFYRRGSPSGGVGASTCWSLCRRVHSATTW